ncbi:MAG: D-alanyl-D-alanine carboxypeptidase family protein [Dehalococcoidia bacterium]
MTRLLLAALAACAILGLGYAVAPAHADDPTVPLVAVDPDIAGGGSAEGEPEPAACDTPDFNGAATPELNAAAWAVYDASSETFLAGDQANDQWYPASLTKIATALVALDLLDDMDEIVTAEVDWTDEPRSARLGIGPGSRITIGDLFIGMLTVSGNDAAEQLAIEAAGSEADFVDLMNERAEELGLENTHFENAHGIDYEGHLSTAHDLALLAAEAMENEFFREIVGAPYNTVDVDGERWDVGNTNGLLSYYDGATGIKTGTTAGSGMSLAASAMRDGHEVIAIVLGSRDRVGESAQLLDWAFTNHGWNC